MEHILLPDVNLAYVAHGVGTPVVLLHGFPLDHTMWASQIEALKPHCRVIAPDLRGFGASTLGNADPLQGVTMEQYADDVAHLLDALEVTQPIVLAGFSMGGYIAWQFVRKYAARLRALIQLDTRAAADTDEARSNRLKMAGKIYELGSARVAEMMGPNLFSAGKFASNSKMVQDLRAVVSHTSPAAIACAQRGMAARPDMRDFLPKITIPTLVVCGSEDAITPAKEMQEVAAAIPNSRYVEIPGAGHMSTMENPEAVNQAMTEFVTSLE